MAQKKMKVAIHGVTDSALFAAHAAEMVPDGDVVVSKGKFSVDGKSILGILSLDMTDGVLVSYPESATQFEEWLSQYKKA